jgi:photosystem II stability/assembly factor-like uncharacterized protein
MKKTIFVLLFFMIGNLYSQTWEMKFKSVFASVSFPDENIGWAVGYEGSTSSTSIIYKTTNGGDDWIRQYEKNGSVLASVYFMDIMTGWACGSNGLLLKTTDGGDNWVEQTSNTSHLLQIMYWLDPNNGWIVTADGSSVLKTTNGGNDWTITWTGTNWWLGNICFVNSNIGWVVGDHGSIRKTTDGGSTWNSQVSGTTAVLRGVCFIDSLTGWTVGGRYDTSCVIFKTTDGGLNWIEQTSPINWHLMSVQFLDANNGWAVGFGGTIIQTTNGGENWTAVLLPLTERSDLLQITFHKISSNEYTGWICGFGLTIYKANVITTSVKENEINSFPTLFKLDQNYPNPFNPSTTIQYQVAKQGNVEVTVFDIGGRTIKTLLNTEQHAGTYTIQWDSKNNEGKLVSSGTYFYQVKSDNVNLVKKMLLIK